MARLGFNANEVAPSTGGGPLPEGRYQFQVVEEALVANSANTGEVLKLTYEVISESEKGRKVYVTMNMSNPNPVAERIGGEELSALCHATGQMQIEDSEELLWKSFTADTVIVEETYKGKTRDVTRIKKYIWGDAAAMPANKSPARGASSSQTSRPPASRPGAPAPETGRALPWQGNRNGPAGRVENDDIPF